MLTRKRLGLDVGSGLVPRAADGSRLWLALAVMLAVGGRRFGRRAASRGLLALGAAEIAVAATKQVTRRPRPRRRPPARLARRSRPSTSSMPSAHSAAAFAFAVGAATELPLLAAPLTIAASVVSYSRVRTGHHHPSDVVVGALVGTVVAAGTRRVWPVAPHEPAFARRAGFDIPGTDPGAGTEGARISLVANPNAGPALSSNPAETLADRHPQLEVIDIEAAGGIDAAIEQAAGADIIGVSGGDGTVNAVAHHAHHRGTPLLVVPGGTLNHFAGALGIMTVDDVSAVIDGGRAVAVDVARIAGHTFLNTASFGVYPELVDRRERLESRIGKWPALAVALAAVLGRAQPIDVEIDGRRRHLWMAFIGNCRYHPAGFAPSWRERLDDGQLDIRLVDADAPWSRARLVLAVLTGRLGRSSVYEATTARRVEVRSPAGGMRLAADGEVFDGPAEFVIEKADSPLTVLVP